MFRITLRTLALIFLLLTTGATVLPRLQETPPPLLVSGLDIGKPGYQIVDPTTGRVDSFPVTWRGEGPLYFTPPRKLFFHSPYDNSVQFVMRGVFDNKTPEIPQYYDLYRENSDDDDVIILSYISPINIRNLYTWSSSGEYVYVMVDPVRVSAGFELYQVDLNTNGVGRMLSNVNFLPTCRYPGDVCLIEQYLRAENPGDSRWQLSTLDPNTGEITIITEQTTSGFNVTIADDAPLVAFSTTDYDTPHIGGVYDFSSREMIYAFELESPRIQRLSLSPDGRWLVMATFELGGGPRTFHLMDVTADEPEPIHMTESLRTVASSYANTGRWSPDSTRFIFTGMDENRVQNLYQINTETMTLEQLTTFTEDRVDISEYDFSPMGKWIALSVTGVLQEPTGQAIYIMDTEGDGTLQSIPLPETMIDSPYVCIAWETLAEYRAGNYVMCDTYFGIG